jgi:putative ABC transport system permease protein
VAKRIRLDSEDFEIIGAMPRGFTFRYRNIEVWTALVPYLDPALQMRHDLHFFRVIGRLRAGVPVKQAAAELNGIAARCKQAHPEQATGRGASAIDLHASMVHDAKTSLLVLFGAVCCLLLIACVNLANLILTRSAARTRELCVRAAIGASRSRIVHRLLTESVLLSLVGGAIGALLTVPLTDILISHAPGADAILPGGNVPVDPIVYVLLLRGSSHRDRGRVCPPMQVSRADLANGLKESSRSNTRSLRPHHATGYADSRTNAGHRYYRRSI